MNNAQTITPEQLELFIAQANARYMVALFILLGMVAIGIGTISLAFGWRKTGFSFIGIYGGLMSFIGVGFCYIFGPIILVAAIGGLVREWLAAPQKTVA